MVNLRSAARDVTDTADRTESRRAGLALLSVCLGFFMVLLDGSALNVALPAIGADVHASISQLQWLVNAYTIPLASLLLSAGVLCDRIGSRRIFLWSLGAFALTSLACALSPNIATLITFRALQGVSAAGLLPTTLAIIVRTYPDPLARARAITWWGGTGGIALAVGPIGGGLLTEFLGWRWIFLINVPVGIAALYLAARNARETERHESRHFDVLGQIVGATALAALVAFLIEGSAHGWSSTIALALLTAAAVTGLAFITIEHRSTAPMLPLVVFHRSDFSASIVGAFAFQFGAYGIQFMLALYVQQQWQFSALRNGLLFLPFALMWTLSNLWLNRILVHKGMVWFLTVGSAIAALGAVVCLGITPNSNSWPILMIGTALTGFGSGLLAPSCNAAAMVAIDRKYTGLASGILNTSRQIGMAIGVAILGAMLSMGTGGVRVGLGLVAVCFVIILLESAKFLRQPA